MVGLNEHEEYEAQNKMIMVPHLHENDKYNYSEI